MYNAHACFYKFNKLFLINHEIFKVMTIISRAVASGGGLKAPQFLAEELTLSQPGGADYAHDNTTRPNRFSDLLPSLQCNNFQILSVKDLHWITMQCPF